MGGKKVTSGFRAVAGKLRFPLWARFLTAAFVIILSVGTATAASLLMYIEGIAEELKLDPEFGGIEDKLSQVEAGEPQTIMILGSDKRPEFKNDKFRGLSDTTMLLRVDPDRNAIALFSLPRDLKVEIPGYGTAKLNEAYAYGGPELTLETIQNLTDGPRDRQPRGSRSTTSSTSTSRASPAPSTRSTASTSTSTAATTTPTRRRSSSTRRSTSSRATRRCAGSTRSTTRASATPTTTSSAPRASRTSCARRARRCPPEVVFAERKELIDIFTEHTTSDIDDAGDMLQVLKLFIEARDAPVKEVHFEGTPRPVVRDHDHVGDQQGGHAVPRHRGHARPARRERGPGGPGRVARVGPRRERRRRRRPGPRPRRSGRLDAQLIETTYGKELAKSIRARKVKLPIYYPTVLETGTEYAQKPRVYKINGTGEGSPPNAERAAYKWVFSRPALGEYYGFMATRWKDPPILKNPSEEREIDGRTYKLYYDGDRLKLIAWQDDEGSFWLHNTLIQSLSDREMIDIAKGMTELPKLGGGD